ncbi:MAG TPA: glutamine synthetase family protein [Jatrophihabitans sp.]|nr:glutamine synthetase family protein [Jatrophihabitans sp.]
MYSRPWSRLYTDGSVGRPSFVAEFGLWDEHQLAVAEQLEAELDELDFVRLAFCDPHGLARSKTLTAAAFRTVLRNGMDFSPGPFLFDTGHAVAVDFQADGGIGVAELAGCGDMVVVPDPTTFQVLPGREPRTAWVLGDEYLRDGSPHPLSTRHVLRSVCDSYTAAGLTPVIGLEVEWYLTRALGGGPGHAGNGFGLQGAAPRVQPMNAGYQFNSDSYYDTVAGVAEPLALQLLRLGLPLRSMEHESGPGQLETTFNPMQALDAADAMLLFRTLVKQNCSRLGYHASFMSLPKIDGFDPSGWHLHQSVMDAATGRNLFADAGPDGISAQGLAYINGLLDRAREYCLLSVPTVNGYRRLGPDFPFSPTRIGWSTEDRTVLVRVLGGGDNSAHLENRVGEPCANPYLLMAAQLHAGLQGLLAPAGPTAGTDQVLPQSLAEAVEVFTDGRATELLGRSLALCLTKLKQSEVTRYEEWCAKEQPTEDGVTEWEQREYFENY